MITSDRVNDIVESVDRLRLIRHFTNIGSHTLEGRIGVDIPEREECLEWDVRIMPFYPYKTMGGEPILFTNLALIDYPHIMRAGNLCLHTPVYDDAESQLEHDIQQLREWVIDYYVNGKQDANYEHLVVEQSPIRDIYYTFAFAETEREIPGGDFGTVKYASLMEGVKLEKMVRNFVGQQFISRSQVRKDVIPTLISESYQKFPSFEGMYLMLREPPAKHRKFLVEDFSELSPLLTQSQRDYLHTFVSGYKGKSNFIPVFCGYKIPGGSTHWQVFILFADQIPLEPFHVDIGGVRHWHTRIVPGKIEWATTSDISCCNFFGRGVMSEALANQKIMIMGLGAIGSTVAETLTRCGAKHLTLYDIDDKEPGNVCRSAYRFFYGVTTKVSELEAHLIQISPHVECDSRALEFDISIKAGFSDPEFRQKIVSALESFDVIIDCTTDNHLMQILDSLQLRTLIVNLSITNHAQDLVCAISPNLCDTVRLVYTLLGRPADDDLYNPTGCWTPTFKASYNDMATKVQFATKHVMAMLSGQQHLQSFYLTEDERNLTIHPL